MFVYLSQLNGPSKTALLRQLANRDKTQSHIIITPERCSLSVERELFDCLEESAFFDIVVSSFSRLAKQVLQNLQMTKKILSKHSAVALIKKIVLENKDKFKYFCNVSDSVGFCEEMFNTISMFKSCNISTTDISSFAGNKSLVNKSFTNESLANKMHDIKIVYELYEDFFATDFTDSFNQLAVFLDVIDKDLFKNTNFYFVEHLEFTDQMFAIIEKLERVARSVSIATFLPKNKKNNSVYDSEIYDRLAAICFENNYEMQEVECYSELETHKTILAENLFLPNDKKRDLPSVMRINKFKNIDDELMHTFSNIRLNVINRKEKFADFSIVVPSLEEYEKKIISYAAKFEVPIYLDISQPLKDHYYVRFLKNLMQLMLGDYSQNELIAALSCDVLGNDYALVCELDKYFKDKNITKDFFNSIKKESKFAPLFSFFENLEHSSKKFCITQSVSEHIAMFKQLLQSLQVESRLENVILHSFANDAIMQKQWQMVVKKVEEIMSDFASVLGEWQCDEEKFVSVLVTYFESVSLTLPPISADTVFVGDYYFSRFSRVKNVFVLGMNEGKMPSYLFDIGIVSDNDITALQPFHVLSPSVAKINKRKRFKAFECLFFYTNKLTLSYCTTFGKQQAFESSIMSAIKKLYGDEAVLDGSAQLDLLMQNFHQMDKQSVLFNNCCWWRVKDNFVNGIKNWNVFFDNLNFRNIMSTLANLLKAEDRSLVENEKYENVFPSHQIDTSLFFKKDRASVSQFENYYSCPYKYFVNYGLEINERVDASFNPLNFGNILHAFTKELLTRLHKLQFDITEKALLSLTEKLIVDILKNQFSFLYLDEKNVSTIAALQMEAKRIALHLLYQIKHSEFEISPQFLELPFGYDKRLLEVELDRERKINIVGVIDRVDTSQNFFRVIDYKTGSASSQFSNFGELASGSKIQLFVYLLVFQTMKSSMQPSGVFYMPLTNKFAKGDVSDNYKLSGVMLNDVENFKKYDAFMQDGKSRFLSLQLKDGALSPEKFAIFSDDFDFLSRVAVDKMKKAGNSILSADFSPQPLAKGTRKVCEYCSFLGLCNFNERYGNKVRYQKNISSIEKLREEEKEEEKEENKEA